MTKKFKYVEYEKLSDVVRDWELHKDIYIRFDDGWRGLNGENGEFYESERYAKRVEIKEKTVEAWVIFDEEGIPRCVGSGGTENLPSGWENIKLTGVNKE